MQTDIITKTEAKVVTKAANEIATSFRDMLEENTDKKNVENQGAIMSKLNTLKAKKGMLPNPQSFKATPINNHYNTPSKPKPNSYSR